MFSHKMTRISALSAVALLALAGCGSSTDTASNQPSSSSASASASTQTAALTVEGAWIKAATGNMTGAFATLTNTGDEPITIGGASNDAAGMVQLHTTEIDPNTGTSTMKEAKDGFTIEPGASFELAPGGNHIMLMEMKCSLVAGTTSVIKLDTSAGAIEFDAEVRDFSGAKEEYAPGEASAPAHETMSEDHSMHGEGDHSAHGGEHGGEHGAEHGGESAEAVLPQCA
ncbi:copper chaperone PCu(A)C [Rothia endophytica]|uniref:copper chaperone PCu(A)C n=1 Tax=Rothia endophytica TaxID=1324766 RepID=UPI001F207498|nr:copper chaperone PCu(A)C [Rothia endophytica]